MSISHQEINDYWEAQSQYEKHWIENWHYSYNAEKIKIIMMMLSDIDRCIIIDMLPDCGRGTMSSWSNWFVMDLKKKINMKQYKKCRKTNPEWFV